MVSTTKPDGTVFAFDDENRATKETYSNGLIRDFTYTSNQTVIAGSNGITATYNLNSFGEVAEYKLQNGENNKNYSYTYDSDGNITTISLNGSLQQTFTYNSSNELIRANDQFNNTTYVYEYDSRGNILFEKEYAYTTEDDLSSLTPTKTDSFTYYSNEGINWQDELATFNGNTLTYDEGGNLTSYNGYTYTWVNGRQLAEISNGTNTYSYTYDDNGIRTSKTVNGVTTNYITDNGTILAEYTDSYSINYWYDEIGNPIGFIFKDKAIENAQEQVYIYTRNMQGDMTGILDSSGTLVTQYSYDSWGNITNICGTLSTTVGNLNGLRYRGYYYDNETGYYYLQSRYYCPDWCRFINSDDVVQGELNLFGYCYNNSVNISDPKGNKPKVKKISLFIFTSTEFELESKIILQLFNKIYKVGSNDIYVANNWKKFAGKWKKLKYPDFVILNYHGDENSVGPVDSNNVGKLQYKGIDTLVVLGCNCAHQSAKWSNICEKLAKRISGKVIGSDGTVCSLTACFISLGDKTWKSIEKSNGGKRKNNVGWVIYYYNPRKKKIYCTTMGKWMLFI